MLFLAISTLITFLCVILYALYFPSLPIVVYYRLKAASEGSKTVSSDLESKWKQTKMYCNTPFYLIMHEVQGHYKISNH